MTLARDVKHDGQQNRKLVVAIDGPVGSGKSTVARRVADLLGYTYLDSGAMYRAIGWKALREGISLDSHEQLEALANRAQLDLVPQEKKIRVIVDGEDITDLIRTHEVSHAASVVAVAPEVRHALVAAQRRAGAQGGIVMEGRDIGSVVFPDADLKIYLDASPEVRAERRWLELRERDEASDPASVLAGVRDRDRRDRERKTSPLVRAPDAVVVDNTAMDAEETARVIALLAQEKEKASAHR